MAKNEAKKPADKPDIAPTEVIATGDAEMDALLGKMTDVTAIKAKGWLVIEAGTWVYGRLNGRYAMSNGRGFYQVEVTKVSAGAECVEGKGDDTKNHPIVAGDTINIGERSALEVLRPYAESDGVFDVFIHAADKKQLESGNTWWDMQVKTTTVRKPSQPVRASGSMTDLPF